MTFNIHTIYIQYTRVLFAFILLSNFSGLCEPEDYWTQPFHDACKTAHTDSKVYLPLAVAQEYALRGAEFIWGHPSMSGDYVIVTGFKLLKYPDGFFGDRYATNRIHCFSVESGEEIWTLEVKNLNYSPLISKNTVLVAANTLQSYNMETGELIWEREIAAESMPTLCGDTAYIIASEPDLGLYAVDIHQGEYSRIDISTKNIYTFGGYITVANNILYLPYFTDTQKGILAMNCHTGDVLWKTTDPLHHGSFVLCDWKSLYYINDSSELLALSRETGELLWVCGENLSLSGNLSADDSYIYTFSRYTLSIWCIDKKTGDAVWQSEPIFQGELLTNNTFLCSSENYVFVSQCPYFMYPKNGYMYESCEFFVHALDSKTGAPVWSSCTFGFPPGPFALCRTSLVVGSGSKVFVLGHLEEEPEEGSLPGELSVLPTFAVFISICCFLLFVMIWAYKHHLS